MVRSYPTTPSFFPHIIRTAAFAATVFVAFSAAFDARAVDLGDLNVPPDRIPTWYPFEEAVYDAARNWSEYDVTCTLAEKPCASGKNSYQDMPAIRGCAQVTPNEIAGASCMAAAADDNTVLYFPAGTYNIDYGDQIDIARSNIVIRGAGRSRTIFNRLVTGKQGNCGGASFATLCDGAWDAAGTVGWTGGYGLEETRIAVADSSTFSVGDWVLLTMTANSSCEYSTLYQYPGMFNHIAQVDAVNSVARTLTIDRGLRMNYAGAGCSGHSVKKIAPIENVGIEELTVTADPSLDSIAIDWYLLTEGVVNSWIVNSVFDRNDDRWTFISNTRSLWIQGNDFKRLRDHEYNIAGISIRHGAVDVVAENNTCSGSGVRTCSMLFNGAEGVVMAYNHFDQNQNPHSAGGCERAFQLHGKYTREILVEGNSVNCAIQMADNYWGPQGNRLTAYRNRNYSTVCDGAHNYISVDNSGTGRWPGFNTRFLNIIGNSAGRIGSNRASCSVLPLNDSGIGDWVDHAWIEKNFWRENREIDPTVGSLNGRSCGVSNEDDCPGTNAHQSNTGDPNWRGSYPTSLYRSQTIPPSWWCEEACSWDQNGIGAFGDDFSGTLCKIPAQLRYEGLNCTPLSSSASRPAAPFLLEP